MDLPATTGINNTDNVEQVRIAAPPAAGTYQAVVCFAGTLTNSSQYYSLLHHRHLGRAAAAAAARARRRYPGQRLPAAPSPSTSPAPACSAEPR